MKTNESCLLIKTHVGECCLDLERNFVCVNSSLNEEKINMYYFIENRKVLLSEI